MAMFMNECEIDEAITHLKTAPVIGRYVLYLSHWRHNVNGASDGWHSWPGGYRAAGKLIELVQQEVARKRGYPRQLFENKPAPTERDLARAIGPIKACATRKGIPAPVLCS